MEEGSHRLFQDGGIGCCHDLDGRNGAGESAAGNLALLEGGVLTLEKEQI